MDIRYFFSLYLSVFFLNDLSAQNRILTESDFQEWQTLSSPLISPDGKYLAYSLENSNSKLTSFIVKSARGNWSKKFVYPSRFNFAYIDNKCLIFNISGDSIANVKLGNEVEYKVGFSSFAVGGVKSRLIAYSKSDTLLIEQENRPIHRSTGVIKFFFVENEDKIVMLRASDHINDMVQLVVLDPVMHREQILWESQEVRSMVYNSLRNKLAFLSQYGKSLESIELVYVDVTTKLVKSWRQLAVDSFSVDDVKGITQEDKAIVLSMKIQKSKLDSPNSLGLTVWKYTDAKIVPEREIEAGNRSILAMASLDTDSVIRLEHDYDNWSANGDVNKWKQYCIVNQTAGDCFFSEQMWNRACDKRWYSVSLEDGSRRNIWKLDSKHILDTYQYSPDRRFIVFFDEEKQGYFSFDVLHDTLYQLSDSKIQHDLSLPQTDSDGYLMPPRRGIAGWTDDGTAVFIYGFSDIWRFDLKASASPVDITNGVGKRNNIVFSFLNDRDQNVFDKNNVGVVIAFNSISKDNGFYRVEKDHRDPEYLYMGSYIFYMPFYGAQSNGMKPLKAADAHTFIVRRESAYEYPNFFITKDFRTFGNVSNYFPERKYQWLKSELHTWSLKDGRKLSGILYKPANFDSTKKYPLIFDIYEGQSNGLNAYIKPSHLCSGCKVNPVVMTSNEYLVFRPDIVYKANKAGESALNAVTSAIWSLSVLPWIDTTRLGIQGCSYGGFETNYIVTHSNKFKAACTSSGISDVMGWASAMYRSVYTSFSYQQLRLPTLFWDDPIPYIDNSSLFNVKKITSPLLIFHTTTDGATPFNQGVQLFLAMRRLNKPCWLLEYGNGANHGVFIPEQEKDFSTRMLQFFNCFLKGSSPPSWMAVE